MNRHVVLYSIPGLRPADLPQMPHLSRLMAAGDQRQLVPSFPCVTWPVQANMLTGRRPRAHGVVANGFYWRAERQVEMWTAWNDKIEAPQIWDLLHRRHVQLTSAVWFPMLSKGCGADLVCMPAPVHNPDGSESLWCYTKPPELYGQLRDQFGHFPLRNFWGPLAGIQSSAWIGDSAVWAAREHHPRFLYIYLPHLDYAAQRDGPDSDAAQRALGELDAVLDRLSHGLADALGEPEVLFLAASEYVITPVQHTVFPNRLLREAGLLQVCTSDDGEQLDLDRSDAWALVDHQFAHVFVKGQDPQIARRVAQLFAGQPGIADVLHGDDLRRWQMDHPRSGEVILVSAPDSWQAYYWWLDDARAPGFAGTVDIHRKPGYDPVELCWDPVTKSVPLDPSRIHGSHGAPARDASQRGVLLALRGGVLRETSYSDCDVADIVLSEVTPE